MKNAVALNQMSISQLDDLNVESASYILCTVSNDKHHQCGLWR